MTTLILLAIHAMQSEHLTCSKNAEIKMSDSKNSKMQCVNFWQVKLPTNNILQIKLSAYGSTVSHGF